MVEAETILRHFLNFFLLRSPRVFQPVFAVILCERNIRGRKNRVEAARDQLQRNPRELRVVRFFHPF